MTEYLKELRGFVEGVTKDKDPELLDRLQVRGRRYPGEKPSIISEVCCFGVFCGIADFFEGNNCYVCFCCTVLFGRHTKHDVFNALLKKLF